jgi:hypothetical protein
MHFSNVPALAIAALLITPSLACKCYLNGKKNTPKTKNCCIKEHGVFQDGNDCKASSISEHLSAFRNCCGGQSDCDFPSEKELADGTTIVVP